MMDEEQLSFCFSPEIFGRSIQQSTCIVMMQEPITCMLFFQTFLFHILPQLPQNITAEQWQNNFLKSSLSLTHGGAVWVCYLLMDENCENLQRVNGYFFFLFAVMIIALYTAIAMATIHLISSMLLLYGSIMVSNDFYFKWLLIYIGQLRFSVIRLFV